MALGVTLEVVIEETCWSPKILAQVSDAQDLTSLLLDGFSTIRPEGVQHLPHSVDDIVTVGLSSPGTGVI
jgi:hypothetical protein